MATQTQLKPVEVKLSPKLRERLQGISRLKHRSAHWLMKEAIKQYVEREEATGQFREETIAAWEEYQRTGLHLNHAEVKGWLSTWGTEDEVECPPCHT